MDIKRFFMASWLVCRCWPKPHRVMRLVTVYALVVWRTSGHPESPVSSISASFQSTPNRSASTSHYFGALFCEISEETDTNHLLSSGAIACTNSCGDHKESSLAMISTQSTCGLPKWWIVPVPSSSTYHAG